MSKITTIYNKLLTELASLYPSRTRIFDAYSLLDNPEHIMRNGYGLTVIDTQILPGEMSSLVQQYALEVVLSTEVVRAESQVATFDTQALALLEDAYALRFRLSEYDRLGLPTDIDAILLSSVSGITRLAVGNGRFITINIGFTIQVTEALPC